MSTSLVAAVGPCIQQKCYEVGEDVVEKCIDYPSCFERIDHKKGSFLFDLPGYVINCLKKAGIKHIDYLDLCTYCDEEHFFSFRRSVHKKKDYGCQLSVIGVSA